MISLRPSEPEACDDLAFFLCRHDCRAEVTKEGTILVALPHTFHAEQARMELSLYVRLWQALRGVSVHIELVESSMPRTVA
jgi:hypothetical protein